MIWNGIYDIDIWCDIWYEWYDMVWYDIVYDIVYDMIWYMMWLYLWYDMIWLYLYDWKLFFLCTIWKTRDLSSRFSYNTICTYHIFESTPCFKLVCLHFTTVYISYISLTLHFSPFNIRVQDENYVIMLLVPKLFSDKIARLWRPN